MVLDYEFIQAVVATWVIGKMEFVMALELWFGPVDIFTVGNGSAEQ